MKTIFMKMWLVVAAALTVTLTSCSDDDDNNTSGSDKITYSAEIEVSDDVLSLATVNLQEYGNSGLGAATQLTNTKYDWSKTITSYPAKVGLALSIEPKNQEQTKEKYDITVVYKVTMKDEKGNMKGAGVVFSKKSRVEAAGVSLVLENIKKKLMNEKALIDFTSASKFTQRSKSEF
ncbi:hypothetical protein FYJ72_14425 [Prevotella copri]|uniref:Uncharacterized protein n=1 Tax=Segatella copri TaxID=165179 RepID=A0A6I2U219_9BACT|nr:hypothetical protein [Segatella copri]MST78813.1 hypothetical protein [Segatella copri]